MFSCYSFLVLGDIFGLISILTYATSCSSLFSFSSSLSALNCWVRSLNGLWFMSMKSFSLVSIKPRVFLFPVGLWVMVQKRQHGGRNLDYAVTSCSSSTFQITCTLFAWSLQRARRNKPWGKVLGCVEMLIWFLMLLIKVYPSLLVHSRRLGKPLRGFR